MYHIAVLTSSETQEAFYIEQLSRFCFERGLFPKMDCYRGQELFFDVARINQGIQAAAPVDSYVSPEPWDMPGYDSQVIMAAGAFIQGSSIELSADGPIKPPYSVFFQGGLTWYHAKLGILMSLQKLLDAGIVKPEQLKID